MGHFVQRKVAVSSPVIPLCVAISPSIKCHRLDRRAANRTQRSSSLARSFARPCYGKRFLLAAFERGAKFDGGGPGRVTNATHDVLAKFSYGTLMGPKLASMTGGNRKSDQTAKLQLDSGPCERRQALHTSTEDSPGIPTTGQWEDTSEPGFTCDSTTVLNLPSLPPMPLPAKPK
jgi:hypothetical protein